MNSDPLTGIKGVADAIRHAGMPNFADILMEIRTDLDAERERIAPLVEAERDCSGGPRFLGVCGCLCHQPSRPGGMDMRETR